MPGEWPPRQEGLPQLAAQPKAGRRGCAVESSREALLAAWPLHSPKLSLTVLPARVRKPWVILLGMLLFVAYFLLVAASSSMPLLIGTQLARGVALAVVGALGITYVQDLLPRATGRATALYANTLTTGSLISGILAGATAQALGYRAALLLCGVLSAVGCVLLASVRQPRVLPSPGQSSRTTTPSSPARSRRPSTRSPSRSGVVASSTRPRTARSRRPAPGPRFRATSQRPSSPVRR